MDRTNFDDYMDVQDCIKTLKRYKINEIDEMECLKKLIILFERLQQ